jgi:hypothetical protein
MADGGGLGNHTEPSPEEVGNELSTKRRSQHENPITPYIMYILAGLRDPAADPSGVLRSDGLDRQALRDLGQASGGLRARRLRGLHAGHTLALVITHIPLQFSTTIHRIFPLTSPPPRRTFNPAMVTAQRQQRDSRGADITIRCLKKERERIKRAARNAGKTLNRYMLDAALSATLIAEYMSGNKTKAVRKLLDPRGDSNGSTS